MKNRYTLTLACTLTLLGLSGQTVLSPGQYASLKAHGQLPAGPITILGTGTMDQVAPAAWVTTRGGGGSCGCWVAPDASYEVAMLGNDDMSSELITLPFNFNLFGTDYTALYINNNGNVSFNSPYGTYTASGFPSDAYYMVAPFWGDVDTRDTTEVDTEDFLNGQVLYKVTDHALYVNWVEVGFYALHDSLRNTFQLIITDGTDPVVPGGNNVSFCYEDMQWTTGDASQGINGFGGYSATVGANAGNGTDHSQIGRFSANDLSYAGPYVDGSGVDWLDSTHFYFNTAGGNVPPIFGSDFDCDSIIVEVGSGQEYRMLVLSGGPDANVTCVSSCGTLTNYEQQPTPADAFIPVLFSINATEEEMGTHTVTFTATSDDDVPLNSTYLLYVEIVEAGNPTAIDGVHTGPGNLGVFPNPVEDLVIMSWSIDLSPTSWMVVGLDGKVIRTGALSGAVSQVTLSMEGLATGTYWLQAVGSQGMVRSLFVKAASR